MKRKPRIGSDVTVGQNDHRLREGSAGRIIGGHYRLITTLDEGPQETRQLAEELESGAKVLLVSVPIARDEAVARSFLSETSRLVKLSAKDDRLIRVYGGGQEDGTVFVVLEHLDGPHLTDVLQRDGPLDMERAIWIGLQVAGAVEALHRQGQAHGRLTADDVVLGDRVKVTGLEKALLEEYRGRTAPAGEGSTGQTESRGSGQDHAAGWSLQRADVGAVASLLYRMLTGFPPWDAPGGEPPGRQGAAAVVPPRRLRRQVPLAIDRLVVDALEGRSLGPHPEISRIREVLFAEAWRVDQQSQRRAPGGRLRFLVTDPLLLGGVLTMLVAGIAFLVLAPAAGRPVTPPTRPTISDKSSEPSPAPRVPDGLPAHTLSPAAEQAQPRRSSPADPSPIDPSASPARDGVKGSATQRPPASRTPRPKSTNPPPAAGDSSETPQRRSPVATVTSGETVSRPEQDVPDPAAIIDWLLREGRSTPRPIGEP